MHIDVDSKGLGVTRACADDVGAVLFHIAAIKAYHTIFQVLETLANLRVNASKCVLVPLATADFDSVSGLIRHVLDQLAPRWVHDPMADFLKYLGFLLGPSAPS